MAQEEKKGLAEWVLLLRDQFPIARRRLGEWVDAVREEPAQVWQLWQVATFRYVTYVLGGLILCWLVSVTADALAPPPPASARPAATMADFHVVCSDPSCQHHFLVHRKFGFRDFPVVCPKCKARTGQRAMRCFSDVCQGAWVAPIVEDGKRTCPVCDHPLD